MDRIVQDAGKQEIRVSRQDELRRDLRDLDAEWTPPEDSKPSGEEEADKEMLDFYGNDGDDGDGDGDEEEGDEHKEENEDNGGDEDEQEDEEESELEPPPLPSKRKRPSEPSMGPTSAPKRVAFDLQKPAKGIGQRSKHAPPNPGIKKPTLISKKRR